MTKILAEFDDPKLIEPFIDYMAKKNIYLELQLIEGKYQLILPTRYQLHQNKVTKELAMYLMNPEHIRIHEDPWESLPISRKGSSLSNKRIFAPYSYQRLKQNGLVTILIVLITAIVYCLQLILGNETVFYYLRFNLYLANDEFQIWRYLTPIFMHIGILHIAFNLAMWWNFALRFERVLGRFKLIELVILSGVIANVAQYLDTGSNFGGLSGVVFALIGYIWLYGQLNIDSSLKLEGGLLMFAIIWIVMGYSGIFSHIGNTSHLAGLVSGMLLALKDVYILKVRK